MEVKSKYSLILLVSINATYYNKTLRKIDDYQKLFEWCSNHHSYATMRRLF